MAQTATGARPSGVRIRRRRATLLGLLVLVAVIAAGLVVGARVIATPTAARLCSGEICATLQPRAASTPQYALLPLGRRGELQLRNGGTTGAAGAGVVAFLGASRSASSVLPRTTAGGGAAAGPGRSAVLRLSGVPEGARWVLLRTDGVRATAACSTADASCSVFRVSVRPYSAAPSTRQLAAVLRRLPRGSGAGTVSASAVSSELRRRAGGAAALSAALRTAPGRITVDWTLAPGGEDVSSVRVTSRRADGNGGVRTHDAIAATGSLVLRGLDRGARYIVDVGPVIGGRVAAPVELSAAADGRAVAAPRTPTAPAGWKPLLREDFDRRVPLGRFASAHPGWAWYDGMTDTSRETARPPSQVGLWNSATTVSVHDGALDCRLHTEGTRPQVCAITPTPTQGPWAGQKYGRYSVRFRADALPGYKIAWLLWPRDDDWSQGEIDFPEAALDGPITGSSHRNDGDPSDFAWFVDTGARMDGWHTATIDWRPGRLTFLLDGESWTTTDPAALPRVPMRWTLQAETQIDARPPAPSVQGHILIDWVAAWSRSG